MQKVCFGLFRGVSFVRNFPHRLFSSSVDYSNLSHVGVSFPSSSSSSNVQSGVAHVTLTPNSSGMQTMTDAFFRDMSSCFSLLSDDPSVRVVVLSSASPKLFSAGLDLFSAAPLLSSSSPTHHDSSKTIFSLVKLWQKAFTNIETCSKPVIVAIHGKCIGGGVDLITACDIRHATKDSSFSVKEVKLAITADLGTLQRLSKVTNSGFAREMAYTGEEFSSEKAIRNGLVSEVYETKEEMMEKVMRMAEGIAENSPKAVQATKKMIGYAEKHPNTEDALDYVALWNAAFLKSNDLEEAVNAFFEKRKPKFEDN